MGRNRKTNKHLPRGMLIKHGAYYLKRANKWTRLGSEYGPARAGCAAWTRSRRRAVLAERTIRDRRIVAHRPPPRRGVGEVLQIAQAHQSTSGAPTA